MFVLFFTRWRIVIHGGIDDFSRIPMYLVASNNNQSETVLTAFSKAVETYGLRSCVRSDKGVLELPGGLVHAESPTTWTGKRKHDNRFVKGH